MALEATCPAPAATRGGRRHPPEENPPQETLPRDNRTPHQPPFAVELVAFCAFSPLQPH
jgi:hypothetical protein